MRWSGSTPSRSRAARGVRDDARSRAPAHRLSRAGKMDGAWRRVSGVRTPSPGASTRMQELRGFGVATFLDPCPMDLGRDVEFMAEVAERSGMRIICTTGAYKQNEGLTYTFGALPVEEIEAIYIKELTEGIGDSGIRAGLVKVATGAPTISDYEKKLLVSRRRSSRRRGGLPGAHAYGPREPRSRADRDPHRAGRTRAPDPRRPLRRPKRPCLPPIPRRHRRLRRVRQVRDRGLHQRREAHRERLPDGGGGLRAIHLPLARRHVRELAWAPGL